MFRSTIRHFSFRWILLVSGSPFVGFAQDAAVKAMQQEATRSVKTENSPPKESKWKKGAVLSLSVAQGGSSNWAAGAERFSLSIAASTSLSAHYQSGKWTWGSTLDLSYATLNTQSQGPRKTDDKIDLFSKVGYSTSPHLDYSLVGNFRSQFAPGYSYDYLGQALRRRTSDFMVPAYLTLAPGLNWHKHPFLSVFFSPVSARFVLVTRKPKGYLFPGGVIPEQYGTGYENPVSTLYGVDPEKMLRFELGGFASVNFNKELFKQIAYKSRLDLYSNFLPADQFSTIGPDEIKVTRSSPKPGNVDLFWTNTLSLKINKWLQVSYNLDIIYDDDIRQFGPDKNRPGTQIRSLLGFGVAAKF